MENTENTTTILSISAFLTEDQEAAILAKIKPEIAVELTTAAETQDLILAYYVAKARKEANDAIFSAKRNSFVYELLKHQMMLISDNPKVVDQGSNAVAEIKKQIDGKQSYTLAGLIKDKNLTGRKAMETKTEQAFDVLCMLLEVDSKKL